MAGERRNGTMRASGYWKSKLHPRTYFKAGWRISATGRRAWVARAARATEEEPELIRAA
jgi:hypothetical protein